MSRALVFGGAGTLGRAYVTDLIAKNWSVVNVDFRENEEATQSIVLKGNDWNEHKTQITSALTSDTKFALAVCAAGGFEMEGIRDDSVLAHMDKLISFNLKSAVLTTHVAANHLTDDGLIVLTGAKAALEPTGWAIAYGMTKAATHHLIQSVAADDKVPGSIIGVLPITLDTEPNRKSMPDADFTTWTQPSEVAVQVREWTDSKPENGSLWVVATKDSKTSFSKA